MIEHPRALNRPHLIRVESAAIAAGTDFTWTPPDRQHVEIISLFVQLTTDATVLNRRMRIQIGSGVYPDACILSSGNHPASTVINYWFLRGCDSHPQVPSALGWYGPLPIGLIFEHPQALFSLVHNIQAADQITLYSIRYMMWQDPVASI